MLMSKNTQVGLADGRFFIGHGGALGLRLLAYLSQEFPKDELFVNLSLGC